MAINNLVPNSASYGDTRLDSNVIIGKSKISYIKIKVVNNFVEVYEVEKPFILNRPPVTKAQTGAILQIGERESEYKRRKCQRAFNTMKELVMGNFSQSDNVKFVSLTFNNENEFDINNLKNCNSKFNYFIKKLKKKYPEIKYVVVVEFQKRGAVHYHMVTDLPYIEKDKLATIWEYGFIDIKKISDPKIIGIYITKYFTKYVDDKRLKGQRLYHTSHNLVRPKTYYFDNAIKIRKFLINNSIKPEFLNSYSSDLNGKINYSEYLLQRPLP